MICVSSAPKRGRPRRRPARPLAGPATAGSCAGSAPATGFVLGVGYRCRRERGWTGDSWRLAARLTLWSRGACARLIRAGGSGSGIGRLHCPATGTCGLVRSARLTRCWQAAVRIARAGLVPRPVRLGAGWPRFRRLARPLQCPADWDAAAWGSLGPWRAAGSAAAWPLGPVDRCCSRRLGLRRSVCSTRDSLRSALVGRLSRDGDLRLRFTCPVGSLLVGSGLARRPCFAWPIYGVGGW